MCWCSVRFLCCLENSSECLGVPLESAKCVYDVPTKFLYPPIQLLIYVHLHGPVGRSAMRCVLLVFSACSPPTPPPPPSFLQVLSLLFSCESCQWLMVEGAHGESLESPRLGRAGKQVPFQRGLKKCVAAFPSIHPFSLY